MIKVNKFVMDLRQLASIIPTAYNNHYPNNIGKVQPDGTVTFDCWNLIKSLLNGWDINRCKEVGYVTPNLNTTGDLNGRQLLQHCSRCSQDFTKIKDYPAGTYLFMAETHSGIYIGDNNINGKICNVIECTGAWDRKVLWSYVDPDGTRRPYKGAPSKCYAWTDFGLLTEWVDYEGCVVEPVLEVEDLKPYVPTPTLAKGSRGEKVCYLQMCLNYLGYLGKDMKKLVVDGDFGPNTDFALRDFQRRSGIEVDGIYGPISNATMKKAVEEK